MPAPSRLRVCDLPAPAIMGILNVTPDSFSDGGRFLDPAAAIDHGLALAAAGAAIVDVGGESTRPGAVAVDSAEEVRRVLPVVRALAADGVRVSIDTSKVEVARAALDAGAVMVNDVSGAREGSQLLAAVAASGAAYVAMHTRGTPADMQARAHYDDVVTDVADALTVLVAQAIDAGIDESSILCDPGIGFAKELDHNLALLRALPELAARVGVPVLVGVSRKSFLGRVLGGTERARDDATLAATVWSASHGAAVLRVHDVASSVRALELLDVMARATPEGVAA